MAYYMIQTAFTADAWGTMLKNPQNRAEQVRPMIEKLGGKLGGCWSCFGDYRTMLIVQAPDNFRAAALSLAGAGGGAPRSAQTPPLMTREWTVRAVEPPARA